MIARVCTCPCARVCAKVERIKADVRCILPTKMRELHEPESARERTDIHALAHKQQLPTHVEVTAQP